MIVQEVFEYDGRQLCRTYSDAGKNVHKVGTDEVYGEAIDIYPCPFTYEETEPEPGEDATVEDYEAALEVFGV